MLSLTPAQQRSDVALAAAMCVGAVISAALTSVAGLYGDGQAELIWAIVYALVISVPLVMRRRWPATVALVISAAYFVAVTWRVPEIYAGNIAMFIAFYTVGAVSPDRRRALWTRVGITAGMFVWLTIALFVDATSPTDAGFSRVGAFSPYVAYMLLTILLNVLYFGGAYYFGERTWAAAQQRRALEERTAELESEREVTAEQAVALERVRIARELHDVVAHHVSLMGVQAGVARTVLARDPDAAAATMSQVESSARSALSELRQLLETLRTPEATDSAPSTVGLAGLHALAVEASSAGLPTGLRVIGTPVEVPELMQVNLFRIAQEALTNARRHAGPGATADVRLRYLGEAVELEVSNTGRAVRSASPGMGLIGMRERAAASGGTIEAGPRSIGGFLVRVRVPLERAGAAPAAGGSTSVEWPRRAALEDMTQPFSDTETNPDAEAHATSDAEPTGRRTQEDGA